MRIHVVLGTVMAVAPLFGQAYQRQANIVGGGSLDQGKCTIEVLVDGSAEVQLRGTAAVLRNTGGQPSQWRRFDCTGAMPVYPTNFTFKGVNGRGRQMLLRDPRETGDAVIRIEDPSGGSSIYSFDIDWQGYSGNASPFPNQSGSANDPSIFGPGPAANTGKGKGKNLAMTSTQAVELCQQEVMRQAMQRFGRDDIYFRRTTVDNGRGNQDTVRGTLDVSVSAQPQRYRYNCAVNLNNGRVRSAQIDPNPVGQNTKDYGYTGGNYGAIGTTNANRALQSCESALDRRLADEGYQRAFGSVDIDERTGSNRVYGSVGVTDRSQRRQTIDFVCNVNFASGVVSSVDMVPRR